MKVSPYAGTATSSTEGQSAGPDRMERAKAIFAGEDPNAIKSDTIPNQPNSLAKIKLKTQMSTNRTDAPVAEVTQSDNVDNIEQTPVASEETKPLSPQFAALARQKREIQLAKQQLEVDRAALANQPKDTKAFDDYRERIKTNALSVLQEEGVTYDQLTEQILAHNQDSADLTALKAEMKALKEGLENQSKSLVDRDTAAEQQVLAQMGREAKALVAQGDDYEMIRETGYEPKITELIHKIYKKTGEVMEVSEAANLIEKELLEDSLKFARLKKVQNSLNPVQTQQSQPLKQPGPNTKIMRTLTNRDGVSSSTMSKRDRAIAAMEGRLK